MNLRCFRFLRMAQMEQSPTELSDRPLRFWWCAGAFEVTAAAAAWWWTEPAAWPAPVLLTVFTLLGSVGLSSLVRRPEREEWRACTRPMPLVHSVLFSAAVLLVLA